MSIASPPSRDIVRLVSEEDAPWADTGISTGRLTIAVLGGLAARTCPTRFASSLKSTASPKSRLMSCLGARDKPRPA